MSKWNIGKHLAVFDFDHTLVDGNTDTWITKLYPKTMELIRRCRKDGWCWTDIMDSAFQLLHANGFTQADFNKCFESLQFMEGMKETCIFLKEVGVQCIIISDSNTYFIEHLLLRDKLDSCFTDVFTNPAWWGQKGCLHVEHYHNHTCRMCPKNLCKMQALKTFINKQLAKGDGPFDSIVYLGDGSGDYCPSVGLEKGDYVFAREGYTLLKKLNEASPGVAAEVVPWNSGIEVLDFLQTLWACDNTM
ncbi:predicted protein [Nematostella vectensis]|uniref:Uncharacterized protein n=1 Tax=Nematostella vectensis TaxID=45351 RepID=A7RHV1_NEMVE|nr:pyridoxal phosphate phosphatase PHOSPHO2 [Nematostella vectensis]XP_032222204.1 pyridoxal phosphate phosphatase PHOSPHO2 [Nematostella vectensis]XP_048579410.1 pyridoxal phosphate phosphatase PHOSPHO2 [Nematostella vectensis]EDO48917.1 predicted protein [Nematostella vectensis]|eukprot:XP_001640980.1 predicted protein [Nematostella vectensis]